MTKMLNSGLVVNRQTLDKQVRMTGKRNKDRTKCYADSQQCRPTDIVEGDIIAKTKEDKQIVNTFWVIFFYKVIEKKRNSVVLQSNGGVTKQRNVAFVKKYNDSRQTELTSRSMEQYDETNLQN